MAELHNRKSHDYASNDNPYGNYHFAGQLALLFAHSHKDAGFIGRLGEKLYRLANLESSKKTPSNESIEDTERDICVITTLWMAERRDRRKPSMGGACPETDVFLKSQKEVEQQSNAALCQFIHLTEYLTEGDKRQMISYLRACLRDDEAASRKSENPSRT